MYTKYLTLQIGQNRVVDHTLAYLPILIVKREGVQQNVFHRTLVSSGIPPFPNSRQCMIVTSIGELKFQNAATKPESISVLVDA